MKLNTPKQRAVLWGILLLLASWNYYTDFFDSTEALFWAVVLTAEVAGMLLVGYRVISRFKRFPVVYFVGWTLFFTLCRFLVVFFVLQYHLPGWTVFHDPIRSIPFLGLTSAVLLFLGYSYSIYEWGLAARKEYSELIGNQASDYAHPIVIKSEGSLVRLLPQDILYVEARGEYISYVTHNKSYLSFQRMKKADTELREHGFQRAHRSYILNPINIRSLASQEAVMTNDKSIPISKTYKEAVTDAFHQKSSIT
ncbi:MAG: LytTR family DNA-binding domain-containing protein [Bacteroidota bacterium]